MATLAEFYERVNWEDAPSENTPISAENLNKMDSAIKLLDERTCELSEQKVDNPSTGAVGQIIEIETVDESGKPLTYKAVDKPEGGTGLPEVTTADNGKVLQVVDGVWGAVEPVTYENGNEVAY